MSIKNCRTYLTPIKKYNRNPEIILAYSVNEYIKNKIIISKFLSFRYIYLWKVIFILGILKFPRCAGLPTILLL